METAIMGEYANTNDGRRIKVGTCEDLYYLRRDQLHTLSPEGQREYGRADIYRTRFPFPDEDDLPAGGFDDYGRGLLLPFTTAADDPWAQAPGQHDTLYHACNVRGSYNVNVALPCPASGLGASSPINGFPVEIIQQKALASGEVALVLRCGWCHSAYRLGRDEALALCERLEAVNHSRDYWTEIARRIRAGYGGAS
jgi:hypothetical protein